MKDISLLSIDVDGTLVKDRSVHCLEHIGIFRNRIRNLTNKDPGMIILLNSGTSVGYVEGIAGVYGFCNLARSFKHICESGCFLLECGKRIKKGEDLTARFCSPSKLTKMTALRKEIAILPEVRPEWGMCYSLSYNVPIKSALPKTYTRIKNIIEKMNCSDLVNIFVSNVAVDIVPKPLSKAFSLKYVVDQYGIDMKNVAHVGDSKNDWPVYDVVGLPIAVSNADRRTREYVLTKNGIVTRSDFTLGVCEALDLLEHEKT